MSIRNNHGARARGSAVGFAAVAAALISLSGGVDAHSTIKGTSPASGSILPATPDRISIEFNESARLTAVIVASADGSERKLAFAPESSDTVFTVEAPQLEEGRNEVRWTALSKDGHPIKGTIIIVVRPGATTPAPAGEAAQDREH